MTPSAPWTLGFVDRRREHFVLLEGPFPGRPRQVALLGRALSGALVLEVFPWSSDATRAAVYAAVRWMFVEKGETNPWAYAIYFATTAGNLYDTMHWSSVPEGGSMNTFDELLERHQAAIGSDNPFQARARLLQALWREERGFPIGHRRGKKEFDAPIELGSRLRQIVAHEGDPNTAEQQGWNYLTPRVFSVVKDAVNHANKNPLNTKLFGQPRIWDDLLSSQPLCFNLFAMFVDREHLLAPVLRELGVDDCEEVTRIEFEFSPGRGVVAYGGDRSAFDVLFEYRRADARKGFVACEVKYLEAMTDKPANREAGEWERQAVATELLKAGKETAAECSPTHQMWRDHRLAQAYARLGSDHLSPNAFTSWRFAFIYPHGNQRSREAARIYEDLVRNPSTFTPWTLEQVVEALARRCGEAWVDELRSRYLGWHRLASLGVAPEGAW